MKIPAAIQRMVKEGTKHADTSRVTGMVSRYRPEFKSRFETTYFGSWKALRRMLPHGSYFSLGSGFFERGLVAFLIDFLSGRSVLFFAP